LIQRPIFKPLYFYNVFLKILENTSFLAPSKNTRISYVTTMFLGCWALIALALVFCFQLDNHLIILNAITHVETNTSPF